MFLSRALVSQRLAGADLAEVVGRWMSLAYGKPNREIAEHMLAAPKEAARDAIMTGSMLTFVSACHELMNIVIPAAYRDHEGDRPIARLTGLTEELTSVSLMWENEADIRYWLRIDVMATGHILPLIAEVVESRKP